MNKLHKEYLQAMGVNIYVPRPQFNSISEPSSSIPEQQEITQKIVPELENMPKVERGSEFVSPESATRKQTPTDIEKKPEESAGPSEAAEAEPKPLYFLWQQVGDLLFLTAASEKQTVQEIKLLGAIVESLSLPERVEKGTGNWPLIGHEAGSLSEAQDFLASFVAGRAELCTAPMTLILFGEQSQQQFVEIEGEFDDILGSKVPSQTGLKEFRLAPALVDMLEKPNFKSLAWQSIKDLRST